MRRHTGMLAGGRLHVLVDEPRARHHSESWDFGPPLTWPENPAALPFLDGQGNLVLPLDCPRRFRWWVPGGQSVMTTIKELTGAVADTAEVVEHEEPGDTCPGPPPEPTPARILARGEYRRRPPVPQILGGVQ